MGQQFREGDRVVFLRNGSDGTVAELYQHAVRFIAKNGATFVVSHDEIAPEGSKAAEEAKRFAAQTAQTFAKKVQPDPRTIFRGNAPHRHHAVIEGERKPKTLTKPLASDHEAQIAKVQR